MTESDEETSGGRRRWLVAEIALVAAAIAIGLVLVLAGGDTEDEGEQIDFDVPADVEPVGEVRAGSVAALADCDAWNGGTELEKQATVVDIRQQLSGAVEDGRPQITDPEAFEVFESACSEDFTGAFQLFRIYYAAEAFSNFDPDRYTPENYGLPDDLGVGDPEPQDG